MFRLESPLSIEEEKIVADTIKCGIEVHRNLGPGFRERIYKDALCLELDAQGLPFCGRPN
jgi:GxxExxY protein